MPDMRQLLTNCEYVMWVRLHEDTHIKWSDINGSDTQTLNRLVKKGVAEVYAKDEGRPTHNTYWQLPNDGEGKCSTI